MRATTLISAAVLTTALLATSMTAPATAAPGDIQIKKVKETYQDTEGVFHYAFDPATRSGKTTVETTVGTRISSEEGDCSFTFSGELKAEAGGSGQSVTMDELTFDPVTCTSTYAITVSDEAVLPETSETSPDDGVVAPLASYTYWAGIQAWTEDPVWIVTTRTRCIRYWSPNGTWKNDPQWYKFEASGWTSTNTGLTTNNTTCNVTAKYRNKPFWDPDLYTYVNHTKTKLVANRYNGNFTTSWSLNKSGEKHSWLSVHANTTHS